MKNAFRSCTTFLVGAFKYPNAAAGNPATAAIIGKRRRRSGGDTFSAENGGELWQQLWRRNRIKNRFGDACWCYCRYWFYWLVKKHFGNPPSPFDLLWAFRTLKQLSSSLFTASKTSHGLTVGKVSHVRNHS